MASTKAPKSEMAQPKLKTRSKMETGARSGGPLNPRLRSVDFILRAKEYHVGVLFSRKVT